MTNVFGTNLVTVSDSAITTGQVTTGSHATDNSVHLTTDTGPLTHGVYLVQQSGSFHVTCSNASDDSNLSTSGIKVSANNPLFIPIKDPSKVTFSSNIASRVLTFIMY